MKGVPYKNLYLLGGWVLGILVYLLYCFVIPSLYLWLLHWFWHSYRCITDIPFSSGADETWKSSFAIQIILHAFYSCCLKLTSMDVCATMLFHDVLLIFGPKYKGNNSDIYLNPQLIILKVLHINGWRHMMLHEMKFFFIYSKLIWTITDFHHMPSYQARK